MNSDSCGKRIAKYTDSYYKSKSKYEMIEEIKYMDPESKATLSTSRLSLCKILFALRSKQPLRYDGNNSCFIDTALMSIFYKKNQWIDKYILNRDPIDMNTKQRKILKELKKLVSLIRDSDFNKNTTCSTLRTLFENYDENYNNNFKIEWENTQNEHTDVIKLLEHIFDIPNTTIYKEKRKTSKRFALVKHSLTGAHITSYQLYNKKVVKMSSFFPDYTDIDTETTYNFIDAPILYFNVQRNYLDEKKLYTKFKPPMSIITKNERTLQLVSIIIHKGSRPISGHYVGLLKTNDDDDHWFYYDDMEKSFKVVKESDIFKFDEQLVLRNGVGFVYM